MWPFIPHLRGRGLLATDGKEPRGSFSLLVLSVYNLCDTIYIAKHVHVLYGKGYKMPKNAPITRKKFNGSISILLEERLKTLSKNIGRSMSALIDEAVIELLDKYSKEGGVTMVDELKKTNTTHVLCITNYKNGMGISYAASGAQKKIESGEIPTAGRREDGSWIVDTERVQAKFLPSTQWNIQAHDATYYGTNLLSAIIGKGRFTFPKSLYAVRDTLKFFVNENFSRCRF